MDTTTWELIGLAAGLATSIGIAWYVLNTFPRWRIDHPHVARQRLATRR